MSSVDDTPKLPFPHGVERVLLRAAGDPMFLEDLKLRRSVAAAQAGITLTPTERSILDAIDPAQLAAMARGLLFLRPAEPPDLRFVPPAGCRPDISRGIRPTIPIVVATVALTGGGLALLAVSHGVRPDIPPSPTRENLDAGASEDAYATPDAAPDAHRDGQND